MCSVSVATRVNARTAQRSYIFTLHCVCGAASHIVNATHTPMAIAPDASDTLHALPRATVTTPYVGTLATAVVFDDDDESTLGVLPPAAGVFTGALATVSAVVLALPAAHAHVTPCDANALLQLDVYADR
jgi:hypothetical protein